MDCGLTGLTFKEPSLCKVQFASECDLTRIVNSFLRTGQLPATTSRVPITSDMSNAPQSIFEVHDALRLANAAFDRLPIEVRNLYQNNPVMFYSDFENLSEKFKQSAPPDPEPDPKE